MKILETERLFLRPMVHEDAELVVRWRGSVAISSVSRETRKTTITIAEHLQWFHSTRDQRYDYILVVKESNLPIGSFSFSRHGSSSGERKAELGKYIGEASGRGNKYATEATARWIEFGFIDCDFDCVVARTLKTNSKNIRVNENAGFKMATWPGDLDNWGDEWVLMEMSKQDWLDKRKMTGILDESEYA